MSHINVGGLYVEWGHDAWTVAGDIGYARQKTERTLERLRTRLDRSLERFADGVSGSYDSRLKSIWVDGRSKGRKWEPEDTYAKEYEHPFLASLAEKSKDSGHGGIDFFVMKEFLDAVRNDSPSPIDAYDAAAWSCIVPLSAESIRRGGARVEIPDFTGGRVQVAQDRAG